MLNYPYIAHKLPIYSYFPDLCVTNAKELPIKNELRKWVLKYHISQAALKEMLDIFNRNTNVQLGKDPRTLMRTPKETIITDIDEGKGQYWHQGLKTCLERCFSKINQPISISININIDGVPLFRSSNKTFWPILFNIHEYPQIRAMAIGVFYGPTKPSTVGVYLSPFVDEIQPILENGIIVNGHQINVKIRCFICDSPARAFIKG